MDEGLRGKELEEAYWFNTHRTQLVTIAYGAAWGVVGLIWLILIAQLITYVVNIGATQRAINDITNTSVIYDSVQAPSSLQVKETLALEDGRNLVDVYGLIHNPNKHHVGRFTYTITLNGTPYEFSDGVANPSDDTRIGVFGGSGTKLSSVGLAINDVQWQRVRGVEPRHQFDISDIAVGTTEIANNTTTNSNSNTNANVNSNTNAAASNSNTTQFAKPTSTANTPTAVGETVTQVTAKVFNNSPYGFKRATATVVLRDATGSIAGIQQIVLSDVESFSDTPLRFIWNRRFDFNSTAEVFVETDVWDDANLIAPGQ